MDLCQKIKINSEGGRNALIFSVARITTEIFSVHFISIKTKKPQKKDFRRKRCFQIFRLSIKSQNRKKLYRPQKFSGISKVFLS